MPNDITDRVNGVSINPNVPNANGTPYSTITSSSLSTASPLTLPTSGNDTTNRDNLNYIGSIIANTPLSTPTIPDSGASVERKTTMDRLKSLIGLESTRGDFTLNAQQEAGLAEKTQKLVELNNQAIATKRAYEQEIKRIRETNPTGAFGGGLNIQINDLTRKANEDLANIGILQEVAQNNLAGAQKIIDDKVKAKFEPIDNQIKYLTDFYQLNQNDLSESEKLQATSKIQELSDKRKMVSDAYKTALENAVQNNAPKAIISSIDFAAKDPNATPASIYAAAGGYGADPVKAASIRASNALANQRGGNVSGNKTDGYILPKVGQNQTDVKFVPNAKLTAQQTQKVAAVISGVDLINRAEQLYIDAVGSEYQGFGSSLVSKLKGLYRTPSGVVGLNPKWEAYRDFLDSNRAPIAKGLKGEVGNLAENEQKNALKSFPGGFTTTYTAGVDFDTLRQQAMSNIKTLGTTENLGTQSGTQSQSIPLTLSEEQLNQLNQEQLIP